MNATIIITGPSVEGRGGVANFYLHVLPQLKADLPDRCRIEYVSIGKTAQRNRFLAPLEVQRTVWAKVRQFRTSGLLHVNPSLNRRCAVRDGLFVWQALRHGLPTVVFFRGWSEEFEQEVPRRWLRYFRNTFLRADAIVVLGRIFEEKLRGWGYTGPIHLATTVVDPELIRVGKQRVGPATGNNVSLLFVSRLERDKGVLDILEAVQLLRERGIAVRVTMAGEGKARSSIETWLETHAAAASQVSLPGYVEGAGKAALFNSHDIFLLPTVHGEGLPNALLEAMAAGLPVVTTKAGAIGDVVQDRVNGLFVSPNDPADMANAVEQLVRDPALVENMSRCNRRTAAERFTVDAVSAQLIEVYRSVLTGSAEGPQATS